MADTSARPAALSTAHCRSPRCPRVGSATGEPASSIRRPTIRNVQSLRRHRANRSADAGSCTRPTATACAGKSRSRRARHCAAGGRLRWRSPHNAVTMNASWAACCKHKRYLRSSRARNWSSQVIVPQFEKYQCFGWRCSKGPMDDEVCHGYPSDNARMTESFGVGLGPLPPLVLGPVGKEPN
jgi:hypothetical protein